MLLEAVPDKSAPNHGLSSGSAPSTPRTTSLKPGNLRDEWADTAQRLTETRG